jgi:hypothetical protein
VAGYDKRGLEVLENPRFLIFKDSQLVAQVILAHTFLIVVYILRRIDVEDWPGSVFAS